MLSTPFLIGAMICYVRFAKARTSALRDSQAPGSAGVGVGAGVGGWGFYAAMLVLFVLSLMVKAMGVTMPAVLLLLDFWPLRRWPRTSWLGLFIEKIPIMAIALVASVLGNIAQYQSGFTPPLSQLGMIDRLSNAGVCYLLYAGKLIVPRHLAFFYAYPPHRPIGAFFASFALLALATYLFVRLRQRQPYLIVGWLWFLGTLVPVIGLVQIGRQAMADRYSYFPSVGLLMLLAWAAADWINLIGNGRWRPRARRQFAIAIAGVPVVIFAFVTARQVTYWRDAETLFDHALDVGEESSVAHAAIAQLAYNRRDIAKAVAESQAALKLAPEGRAYYVLGNCLLLADPQRAAGYFRQAISTAPQTAEFHVSLAMAYRLTDQLKKAKSEAQAALNLNAYDAGAKEEMKRIEAAQHR